MEVSGISVTERACPSGSPDGLASAAASGEKERAGDGQTRDVGSALERHRRGCGRARLFNLDPYSNVSRHFDLDDPRLTEHPLFRQQPTSLHGAPFGKTRERFITNL